MILSERLQFTVRKNWLLFSQEVDYIVVHSITGLAAFWGVIAIGLFSEGEKLLMPAEKVRAGLFKGLCLRVISGGIFSL